MANSEKSVDTCVEIMGLFNDPEEIAIAFGVAKVIRDQLRLNAYSFSRSYYDYIDDVDIQEFLAEIEDHFNINGVGDAQIIDSGRFVEIVHRVKDRMNAN